MILTASIVVCALLGLLFLITAVRHLRRRKILGGSLNGAVGLVLVLVSVCAILIAANLRTYQRLTHEQPAGEVQFRRIGDRDFNAALAYPNGARADFELRGDEWQVDARVLKWHALGNLLGFDTAYRLERISGRYTQVEDERRLTRTIYALNPGQRFDAWNLVHRYHDWLPWIDAIYGSATYLPMADGALYAITVSQSGLVARPLNQSAREAVGGWQ